MKNAIDIRTLSSEEYSMYETSKLKLEAALNRYDELSKLPPFAYSKDGKPSELAGEFLDDLNAAMADIDEEDFITERYTPFKDVADKYKLQLAEASDIRKQAKTYPLALKKWFDDNGLQMDESVAWNLGV